MNKKTIKGNVANFSEILMTLQNCSLVRPLACVFVIKL